MELLAEKRTLLGKKSKRLAKDRKIPGVIYGKGFESVPVTLDLISFQKIFKEAGETTLVDIELSGEPKTKILITEVSVHPVTGKIVHANLHKVNLKEKIKASVPIKIVGESPIVKSGEGLLLELIHEIEVEALPADLPRDIIVDVSHLAEVDQGLMVKELPIDHGKVEIIGHEPEDLVVKIDYAEMKEEEAAEKTEAELIAAVEATEQLTEEEKAAKEKEKKEEEEK